MTERTKRIVFILLATALAGLLLLSISVTDLQFQSGMPFPGAANGETATQTSSLPPAVERSSIPVVEVILAVALIIVIVAVPARLIGLVKDWGALRLLIGLVLVLALLSVLPRIAPGEPVPLPTESSGAVPANQPAYATAPLGEPPAGFFWLAAAGLLTGIGLLAIYFWRRRQRPAETMEALSREAGSALQDLQEGKDFSDVIIRCYLQMMQLLRAERGIEREGSMTAREFESWLELHGIPSGPVQRLTYVFEKARYSKEQISGDDERTGKECLAQILQYCSQTGSAG